jgi:hypothetical protein
MLAVPGRSRLEVEFPAFVRVACPPLSVCRRREKEQAGGYPRTPARIRAGGPREVQIALFVAQHHHSPEDCPARHGRGAGLLSHVSASTAARYGVTIYAEALIAGQHVLLLVVEAASHESVARFLASLPSPGDVQIRSACSAEEAVERGGCGPTLTGRFVQFGTAARPRRTSESGTLGGNTLRGSNPRSPRSSAGQRFARLSRIAASSTARAGCTHTGGQRVRLLALLALAGFMRGTRLNPWKPLACALVATRRRQHDWPALTCACSTQLRGAIYSPVRLPAVGCPTGGRSSRGLRVPGLIGLISAQLGGLRDLSGPADLSRHAVFPAANSVELSCLLPTPWPRHSSGRRWP